MIIRPYSNTCTILLVHHMNTKKHILLGITGGIGAYKSAELIRLFSEQGYETKVVMTDAAKAFITPLTLQTLSGFPIVESLWAPSDTGMPHIELAKWADLILIAPATADCIARLAHGFADDLLTTICLASTAPLIIAPAMNQAMWHHPATQVNISLLQERNVRFIGPAEGIQACGDTGFGRMEEPENILRDLFQESPKPDTQKIFSGKTIMITAGPTQEAIDPVRYLTNRSSGKMGYALAETAQQMGANVILISGPTALKPPSSVTHIAIKTANEMLKAVMTQINQVNLFIGAAAVADYRPSEVSLNKIKKNAETLTLNFIKNPDILSQVSALNPRPFVIGFAAETENVLQNAQQKRLNKKLDMIIANPVNSTETGFDSNDNCGWILTAESSIELFRMSKAQMAIRILEAVVMSLKIT
jgi:phosphopantothenoylcysteine decarboxylase/phosphopantothenate--cysteine ligase